MLGWCQEIQNVAGTLLGVLGISKPEFILSRRGKSFQQPGAWDGCLPLIMAQVFLKHKITCRVLEIQSKEKVERE